jgi:hypothetical protein
MTRNVDILAYLAVGFFVLSGSFFGVSYLSSRSSLVVAPKAVEKTLSAVDTGQNFVSSSDPNSQFYCASGVVCEFEVVEDNRVNLLQTNVAAAVIIIGIGLFLLSRGL